MPLFIDTMPSDAAAEAEPANCLTIGLVNNMPDPAVEATERQFVDLIRAAASDVVVRLRLYFIPEVPRSDEMRCELDDRYRDIAELWDAPPLDGLIVTGTEPRAASLIDEPYWSKLADLIDWTKANTSSTIWSCLAAHAAVLHADGIQRQRLPQKRFGVFECEMAALHPMTKRVDWPLYVPHSRYNDLPEPALASCGYKIISRSATAGVDMFARLDRSFFLFFQGHPEYEASTLLREYRRDVIRFLKGERPDYPGLPEGFFAAPAAAAANAFRARALAERDEELAAGFPFEFLAGGLQSTWQPSAISIYEKWIAFLRARKAEARPMPALLRRTWRDWPAAEPVADPT